MAIDPKQVQAAFLEVVQADPAERSALLDRVCAEDAELRRRVEVLLRAHDDSGELPPVLGGPEQTRAYISGEEPGTVVAGRYKLLEEIGEGGMGTVWVAEQMQPVRRKVALKLIKAGMDSKSVLARFEAERQALAVMDHPNIAKVLDGGLTETGRPFFVMEYVKGVPITEYCEAARLSIPERLQLFAQVSQAVQHAHQKGIIHRDLKPSNILVAPYDDRPVPKVIDFGLAKAMHQALTERTLHTAHETVLGTPLYMSPEQAQLNNLDVDTRSDIYSLGVLLYELLTGSTPLEKQRFKQAAWDEVRRIIREEEPPRPSQRLSSSQTLPSLAVGRQTEPRRLTKLVRGELDWIVMKALEKDRGRRYETANGFAADVLRYLAGEPVLAVPPSARYRLGKFVRKHRTALTAVATITVLLVAGAAVSTWQAVRATRAETAAREAQRLEAERAEGECLAKLEAEAKRVEAEQERARAEAGEKLADDRLKQVKAEQKKAEEEKQIAQAVRNFLQQKLLGQADVTRQANALLRGGFAAEAKENPTIRELLDRAARELTPDKIDAIFPKQPLVQAEILGTIGETYRGVGEYESAITFLQRSLALYRQQIGPDHLNTHISMHNLAYAYQAAGKLDLALPLFEETLHLFKAKLGPDHPDTLCCMENFAQAYQDAGKLNLALPLLLETLNRLKAKLGSEHPDTLTSMGNLAAAYKDAGKLDLALPLFQETLKLQKAKLGPDHPETLRTMGNLAQTIFESGKQDLALPLLEETLKLTKAKLGLDHPNTLNSMNNLAIAYKDAGKLDLALPLSEETLKLSKAKLGSDHPTTLTSMNSLAIGYQAAGKLDLAVPLFEETLKRKKAKRGLDHPDTLVTMRNLAEAYEAAGKLDLALSLFEETLKLQMVKRGTDHADTLNTRIDLAHAYQVAGKVDLALPLSEETLKLSKAKLGPDHSTTLGAMATLSLVYQAAGKLDLALPLSEETLKLVKAKYGLDHRDTLIAMSNLGLAHLAARKLDLALPLFEETLKRMKAKLGPDHPDTLRTMNHLAIVYQSAGKWDLALPLCEETLKLTKAKLGPDHPDTLTCMTNVAVSYWQGKQFNLSIPLLEETLKRREATFGRDHLATQVTVSNLGVNYKDAGRLAEAIPLLEESYRAAKRYPELARASEALLDAYAKTGENGKIANLFQEQLREARKGLPKDSPQLAGLLAQVGLALLVRKNGAEAEPLLRECLAIREKTQPDIWLTFNTKSMLGGALLGQKKYADAEPLLLAGYEGMKQREKTIPEQGKIRLIEAVERLVQMYEATGNKDAAAKWKAERAKYSEVAPMPRKKS